MATITKKDLVLRISEKTNLTQQESLDLIQRLIDEIADCQANGDDVVLRNFGSFLVTVTKPKIGRNPRKPEMSVKIPARAVVKFKPGKELKDRVAARLPAQLES